MVEVVVKSKKEEPKKEEKRREMKEFTAKMEAMQEVEPYTSDLFKIKDLINEYEDEAGFRRGYLLKWVFEQMCYFDEFEYSDENDDEESDDDDDNTKEGV